MTKSPGSDSESLVDPNSPNQMRDFAEASDFDVFEVTYADGDEERTRLATDFAIPAGDPKYSPGLVEITFIDNGGQTSTEIVQAVHVHQITSTEIPPELFKIDGETQVERAKQIRDYAEIAASSVAVSDLIELLQLGEHKTRAATISALESIAAESPTDCTATFPILSDQLASSDERLDADILSIFASVADSAPHDVAPYMNQIGPFLSHGDHQQRQYALTIAMEVANVDVSALQGFEEALVEAFLNAGKIGRGYGAYAISTIANENPEPLEPCVEEILSEIATKPENPTTTLNLIRAVGKITGGNPSVAVPLVEDLVDFLDADHTKLRANATALLSEVANFNTEVLEPHADAFVELLDDEDDYTRVNSSATIARIAEDFPATVRPHTDAVIHLLEDGHNLVRVNACWALGHLRAEGASNELAEVAKSDADEEVRKRASWALERIKTP